MGGKGVDLGGRGSVSREREGGGGGQSSSSRAEPCVDLEVSSNSSGETLEAAVLPATEMVGRAHSSEVLNRVSHQQRPPIPGTRGPPPHYKSRPPMYNPPAYPVPAPRTGSNPGPTLVNKVAKPTARYHPSLSGSETDVSTSTENLTQVRM